MHGDRPSAPVNALPVQATEMIANFLKEKRVREFEREFPNFFNLGIVCFLAIMSSDCLPYVLSSVHTVPSDSACHAVSPLLQGGRLLLLCGSHKAPFVSLLRVNLAVRGDTEETSFMELGISAQVSCTAIIREGDGLLLAAGSNDKNAYLFTDEGQKLAVLEGHGGGVISIQPCPITVPSPGGGSGSQSVLTGGWDGACKLWTRSGSGGWSCRALADDLENGVSVLYHPKGCVITASTGRQQGDKIVDQQVRVHDVQGMLQGGQQSAPLLSSHTPHSGPIRGLCLPPSPCSDSPLITCSNDGSVKVVEVFQGLGTMATMSYPTHLTGGQSSFLLSVVTAPSIDSTGAPHPTVYYIASSDDAGNVIVRSTDANASPDAQCQILPHPGTAWEVKCVSETADLVTACQDGKVRVYTRDISRAADPETVQEHQASLDRAKIKPAAPSASDVASYPPWSSAASNPGTSQGQVKVFNDNGKGVAAHWDDIAKAWQYIGEVTGQASQEEREYLVYCVAIDNLFVCAFASLSFNKLMTID